MSRTRAPRLSQIVGNVFMKDGRCAETDPEAFFPEKGEPVGAAKMVCFRCELQAECLDWALEHDERYGVWGGASERDRRKIKQHGGGSEVFLRVQRQRDVRLAYTPITP